MIESLLVFVVYLIIVGLVIWLLLYLIDSIPLPQPFHQVARVLIIVVGIIIVILLLLQLIGGMPVIHPLR